MHALAPLLALALAATGGEEDFARADVDRWLARILPTAAESAWERIPWRASLWDAVREAAEARKPVLLWAMNGHPLGCT